MKRITTIIMTLAVVAACTKTEIRYDQPDQISFAPVAKVSTKAAVASYPTNLPLLVYANAGVKNTTTPTDLSSFTEEYLNDLEFTNTSGAFTNATAYWPTVKALIFAGVSKSDNVSADNVEASFPTANTVTVTDYTQPDTGNNDLMWFQHTTPETAKSSNLEVTMQHACSWLVFNFKGNDVTASQTSPWKVTKVVVKNIYKTGTANLGTAASWSTLNNLSDYVVYNVYPQNSEPTTVVYSTLGTPLTTSGVDISNNDNVIVIPQNITETTDAAPGHGQLEITYEFLSQAGRVIKETKTVSLAPTSTDSEWVAGKKYTYNVTITTAQIKIAPTVATWDGYDADPSTTNTIDPIEKTVE